MDDYDSGDDLFDGEDAGALLASPPAKRPHAALNDPQLAEGASVKKTKSNASYESLARQLLQEKFGYDDFRHEQHGAISSVLQGENTLVVFPTGAGKSLCYQIPAIAFPLLDEQDGATREHGAGVSVIVSPLIALMKDQVDALKRRGISAECLDSTKTYEQQKEINAAMHEGRLRMLYCAPERLNNEGFVETIKHVRGGVRLVGIDEAHCISEWGHSFRPDYLKVARFAQEVKAERIVCLTATATPRVAQDICKAFDIQSSHVYRTSPYRPNLQLLAKSTNTKKEKYPLLFKFLTAHPGSTLVYVTLQKQAEVLADDLKEQGFKAEAFHAGLKAEDKSKLQDDFMAGRVPIVVATIAFGMGIDKADIRSIVHFDLSSTVEEYSQQIGRAGRDGKPSHCMFYICQEDFYLKENFARGDLPSLKSTQALLSDIFDQEIIETPFGQVFKLNTTQLTSDHDVRQSPLNILLATLELRFGFFRAITPEYSSYKFEAHPLYHALAKTDKSREGQAIRNNAKKAVKLYDVDVNGVSRSTKLLRNDIVKKLNEWNDIGAIVLKASGVQPKYRVLKRLPKTQGEIEDVGEKLYADMESREKDALNRVTQVSDLITGSKCFALALAQHFGMGLPDGKTSCGHCTFCIDKKAVVLPPKPSRPIDVSGIMKILDACDARDDPRFLARVAFGIKSPRVTKLKLDKSPVFASLEDHDFDSLIKEFTRACEAAGWERGEDTPARGSTTSASRGSKSTSTGASRGSSLGRGGSAATSQYRGRGGTTVGRTGQYRGRGGRGSRGN